jgi:hypothetical protein
LKKVIYAVFILNIFTLFLVTKNVQEIFTIGAEKDNYVFFSISDVEVDKRSNIYIADSKQSSISKYDKKGNFVKRVGKYGQGPTDFGNRGLKLKFNNGFLYVYDFSNTRVNVLNEDLKIIKNIRLKGKRFFNELFVLKDKLIGPVFIPSEDKKRIYVYDMMGKKISSFFRVMPNYTDSVKHDKFTLGMISLYSHLKMDYSVNGDEFVVAFSYPDKQINLYFYNSEGKFLRKTTVNIIIDKYEFPKFLLKYPFKYSSEYNVLKIDSIFHYKRDYVLINYKYDTFKKRKTVKSRSFILITDKTSGKIIDKIIISGGFRVLKVKNDILYMKNIDDEIEKLHICGIEK